MPWSDLREDMFRIMTVSHGGMEGRMDALERQAGAMVYTIGTKADKAMVELLAGSPIR